MYLYSTEIITKEQWNWLGLYVATSECRWHLSERMKWIFNFISCTNVLIRHIHSQHALTQSNIFIIHIFFNSYIFSFSFIFRVNTLRISVFGFSLYHIISITYFSRQTAITHFVCFWNFKTKTKVWNTFRC